MKSKTILKKLFILTSISFLSLIGCKKEDKIEKQKLVITLPAVNKNYSINDMLNFDGLVISALYLGKNDKRISSKILSFEKKEYKRNFENDETQLQGGEILDQAGTFKIVMSKENFISCDYSIVVSESISS